MNSFATKRIAACTAVACICPLHIQAPAGDARIDLDRVTTHGKRFICQSVAGCVYKQSIVEISGTRCSQVVEADLRCGPVCVRIQLGEITQHPVANAASRYAPQLLLDGFLQFVRPPVWIDTQRSRPQGREPSIPRYATGPVARTVPYGHELRDRAAMRRDRCKLRRPAPTH